MEPGTLLEVEVERPAAGGRMIARHAGRVVLVSGAIPGERVRARVERVKGGAVLAAVVDVLDASPDRRAWNRDPACGGMGYAHIAPPRQRQLKAEVIADAFARLAHLTLPDVPVVAASPDRGYRLRARFHVRQGRLGSFREGTHDLCDPAVTGQLLPETLSVLERLAEAIRGARVGRLEAIEIAENLPADARVVHVTYGRDDERALAALAALDAVDGVTGLTASSWPAGRLRVVSGTPWVSDPLSRLVPTAPDLPRHVLRRHAPAFFQANRYLVPTLAERVVAHLEPGPLVDLYAGVGLFALSAAALGRGSVTAVEADPLSATDLAANARPFRDALRVVEAPVEAFLAANPGPMARTLIVDPPRTGMSREALDRIVAADAPRVCYVSCDVATLARDARRLTEAGYALTHLEAFDLFPNTPHVESLAVFSGR